jgi:ubiquinone/menaquinone biosynthesis C-methylase UbiE
MSKREQLEKVAAVFDVWAESGRAEGMESGHLSSARQAYERLGVVAGHRYLDIGCGNGYTVRWAADVDPSVQAYGLDLSEKMVERARLQSESQPNARFIHAPFPLPILKAESFDAIFSMEVFYYLPELQWALVSVLRLLRPGGLFACIVDFYAENEASHKWPSDLGVQMNLLSESQWRDAMTDVGFEVVEQCRLVPDASDTADSWKHTTGSLLTLGRRPLDS